MGYDKLLFHEQYAVIMYWTASNSMKTCNNSLFRSPFSAPAAKFTITLQCEVFYLPPVQLLIKSWFHNKIYYWFYHPTNRYKDKLYYYRTGSELQTTTDKADILACPSIQLHWSGSSLSSTQFRCFYGTHNFIAVCSTLPVNQSWDRLIQTASSVSFFNIHFYIILQYIQVTS